jgi:hypothetical protein
MFVPSAVNDCKIWFQAKPADFFLLLLSKLLLLHVFNHLQEKGIFL